jgi:hypothetical protein
LSGTVLFSLLTRSSDAACAWISKVRISVGIAANAAAEDPGHVYWRLVAASVSSLSSDDFAFANVAALGWNLRVVLTYWSMAIPSTRRFAHAVAPEAEIVAPAPGAKLTGSSAVR